MTLCVLELVNDVINLLEPCYDFIEYDEDARTFL